MGPSAEGRTRAAEEGGRLRVRRPEEAEEVAEAGLWTVGRLEESKTTRLALSGVSAATESGSRQEWERGSWEVPEAPEQDWPAHRVHGGGDRRLESP